MKMMRLENSQRSKHTVMYLNKRGMTGGTTPHPLAQQWLFILEFLDIVNLCESPTLLKVVGTSFARLQAI